MTLTEAIQKHDATNAALWAELDKLLHARPSPEGVYEKAENLFEQMDASAITVGEVFYKLTKHINCRDNCLLGCGRSEWAKYHSHLTFDVAGQIPAFFRKMAEKFDTKG